MLSKKIFDDGLEEIEIAFNGFTMTKQRADIWYKYSKHLEDSMWEKKIASCIKGCRKVPTLADILDIKGYYFDSTINSGNKYYEPDMKNYEYKPIPKELKEKIKQIAKGIK